NTYYLSKWFKQNSLVFVTGSHTIWAGDKKPSKRFGNLIKSSVGSDGGGGGEGQEDGGGTTAAAAAGEDVLEMLEVHRGEFEMWVRARMAASATSSTGRGRGRA
ncbi:MAG: hypothetical protein LQ352_003681, partial [Teloschistes flavicans]